MCYHLLYFLPKLQGLLSPNSTRRVDTAKDAPLYHPHRHKIYQAGERPRLKDPTLKDTHRHADQPPIQRAKGRCTTRVLRP